MQLDKAKIKQSFAAASVTYDKVAELQRTVGTELLATINSQIQTGTLLDLGCGTGFLTAALLAQAQPIIALDIALPMLQLTRSKLAAKALYVCADAERLPFAEHSVTGVFSNLALQWCVNLEAVFTDIKRILKPGGRLVFSTFGPQTLQELKLAWAKADDYEHVNEFYSEQQLIRFLQLAGYREIKLESRLYTPSYSSVLALMRELKHIGAHNVMSGRNKNFTSKTRLQQMLSAYQPQLTGGQILASFEVIMVTAS